MKRSCLKASNQLDLTVSVCQKCGLLQVALLSRFKGDPGAILVYLHFKVAQRNDQKVKNNQAGF